MEHPIDPVEFVVHERHFLQGDAWGAFQQERGNEVLVRSGDGWSYLAIIERRRFSSRIYVPYGPVYETAADLVAAVADLTEIAKTRHLDFVRFEPRHDVTPETLGALGARRSHHDVQPAHTIVNLVDAEELTEDQVIAQASSTFRRRYRKALREGINYKVSQDPADVEHFIEMIHDVADRTGMNPHTDEYYRLMAKTLFPRGAGGVMLAELEGRPIASILYFTDGKVLSYAHAANFSKYRDISPATGLFVFAMVHARATGHTVFDTYGVAAPDAPEDHPWTGLTTFKVRGGGTRVETSGTWEIPVRKLRFALYHTLNGVLERRK